MRRRQLDQREAGLLAQRPGQPLHPLGLVRQHHALAAQQRHQERGHRQVEGERGVHRRPVALARVRLGRPRQVAAQPAVGHGHALGPPGRAGGEDDVRQALRGEAARGRGFALRRDLRRVAVQAHRARAVRREALQQRLAGQEHRGGGVLQHAGQPLRGVRRVQRHVGGARLEDAQHGGDHLRAALQAQTHARLRPHAQAAEVPRQPVGGTLQFRVGERPPAGAHRHGVRGAPRLPREALVDVLLPRVPGAGGVPRLQHLRPLAPAQQRQLRKATPRLRRHLLQQGLQVPRHAGDGRRLEERRAVDQRSREGFPVVVDGQLQVELGDARSSPERLRGEASERERVVVAGAVQRERHLEDRGVREAALHPHLVDQALEGKLLVVVRPQRRLPHPLQQPGPGGVARQVDPQRQQVDEEADQPFRLAPGPPRDRGADDHVLLPRVAGQQRLPAGQQRHEQRRPLPPRERPQPPRHSGREGQGVSRRARALPGGARAVGGDLQQRGGAGQALPPVADLRL